MHLIRGSPLSDGSPRWCHLLIVPLSVSLHCWSLLGVSLMTLECNRSSAIINLTRLTTVHYVMHLISCQVS